MPLIDFSKPKILLNQKFFFPFRESIYILDAVGLSFEKWYTSEF